MVRRAGGCASGKGGYRPDGQGSRGARFRGPEAEARHRGAQPPRLPRLQHGEDAPGEPGEGARGSGGRGGGRGLRSEGVDEVRGRERPETGRGETHAAYTPSRRAHVQGGGVFRPPSAGRRGGPQGSGRGSGGRGVRGSREKVAFVAKQTFRPRYGAGRKEETSMAIIRWTEPFGGVPTTQDGRD